MLISQFQTRVVSLLRELLKEVSIKVEVPVQKLFPEYPSGRERYDIVVKSMRIIIECHGEQHRHVQTFGEKDPSKAVTSFVGQKHRDLKKEETALGNGWSYVQVWYNELPKDDTKALELLKSKIMKSLELE